jgi:hypothetical protein
MAGEDPILRLEGYRTVRRDAEEAADSFNSAGLGIEIAHCIIVLGTAGRCPELIGMAGGGDSWE